MKGQNSFDLMSKAYDITMGSFENCVVKQCFEKIFGDRRYLSILKVVVVCRDARIVVIVFDGEQEILVEAAHFVVGVVVVDTKFELDMMFMDFFGFLEGRFGWCWSR